MYSRYYTEQNIKSKRKILKQQSLKSTSIARVNLQARAVELSSIGKNCLNDDILVNSNVSLNKCSSYQKSFTKSTEIHKPFFSYISFIIIPLQHLNCIKFTTGFLKYVFYVTPSFM